MLAQPQSRSPDRATVSVTQRRGSIRSPFPSLVDRHLDSTCGALVGNGEKGLPPLVKAEGVGEHRCEVDPARGGEIEVVRDPVLAAALDLLHTEGVGADPADLLEVERTPLP